MDGQLEVCCVCLMLSLNHGILNTVCDKTSDCSFLKYL